MNLIYRSQTIVHKVMAAALLLAVIVSIAPVQVMEAQAASTGLSVNDSSLTVERDLKVNFVLSTLTDNSSTTDGTFVILTDNGGNGQFYTGTTLGNCNSNTPDPDNKFSIDANKGVCYSNATAGTYIIAAQLMDAQVDGNSLGEPIEITVVVTEPAVIPATAQLRLQKVVLGGSSTPASFTLSAAGPDDAYDFSDAGDSTTFHTVEAGAAYTLTESAIADYSLSDLECDGGTLSLNNVITLGDDVSVTCTFTNTHESYNTPIEISYLANIEMCKYRSNETAIEGWGMTLTNGEETYNLVTGENGCVTKQVNLFPSVFEVIEENRANFEQVSVFASEGFGEVVSVNEDESINGCAFYAPKVQAARLGEEAQLVAVPTLRCDFYNREIETPNQCQDATNSGADVVIESNQAMLKNGNPITDINRINASSTLNNPDWVVNGSTGFYSLGFGGSVTVKFDQFVNDVAGTDFKIYEATNGNYPLELAKVEVSQNGSTWFTIDNASNTASNRVSELDFSMTGLTWLKYVRITDISNPALHDALADGFDVDAVVATKTTCSEPKPVIDPTGACEIEGHKYDSKGNPLAGWFIGLKKFVSYGEVEEDHVILNDTTDNQGYYCLEWDNVDFSEVEPGYDSFLYRIFEKLQTGWKFLSIEKGADYDSLAVVAEDDIWYGDNEVGTQFGETNGTILASAEYHVDFYNATTSSTSTDGRYTLSVALSGEGEGSVTSGDAFIACSSEGEAVDCSETYASGTVVTLTAVASLGSNFDNSWEVGFGTCTGNTTPCQVVMTQNVSLIAHFDLNNSSNGGNGSGGRRNSSSGRATPTVAGISDSEPQGLVLGDQVSVVPYGAANTGAGGTSQEENLPVVMILMTLISVAVIAASTRRIFG